MRVLVVEDEADLGAVFHEFLVGLGHQPVIVRTAEAALGAVHQQRPDAILLDVQLPGISGIDFLQLRPVRESGVPVVAVSGVATESQARECLRRGAVDFLGKPVSLERLTDVLTFLEPQALQRSDDTAAARPDRRRSPRARVEFPVRIIAYKGTAWDGTGVEIGVSSVKVRADAPLEPGTAVKLCFSPPDGAGPLEVISLVVRVDADGAVLSLVRLPAADARRLSSVVQRLRGA
jgi:CheY-like chemotaxis protein